MRVHLFYCTYSVYVLYSHVNTRFTIIYVEILEICHIFSFKIHACKLHIMVAKTTCGGRIGCRRICNRKRKYYRKQNRSFLLAHVAVCKKYEHHYQQKKIPIVVEHTPLLLTFYYNMRGCFTKFQFFCEQKKIIMSVWKT